MATLSCTSSSETSLTFRLSGMTSGKDYGYSRTFYWECDGQSKTTTVSATSTATSISKTFSGLSPGTTYTCYLEFTNGYGTTYSWDADGTTDEPAPTYYSVYVETVLDGNRYDLRGDSFREGTNKTISGWMSAVGVSVPSGDFKYAYVGSSATKRTLSYSVTANSNISISVFYETPTVDYADIVCIVYTNGGQAKQGVWEDQVVGDSYTYNDIISNTVGSLPSGYNLDHYSWNGSTTTATSFTLPSNGGLLAIYLVSPTPTYYTMTIQVYIDDVRQSSYDGSIREESGKTMSAEEWVSQSSVSVPSRYEFSYLEVNGTPYWRYSLQSNVTAKAYFYTPYNPVVVTSITLRESTCLPQEQVRLYFTYSGQLDSSGSWQVYQTTTPSYTNPVRIVQDYSQGASVIPFTAPSTVGTYYIWLRYYGATQGWSDPTVYATLTVQQLPQGKAYIYNNGQWKLATAYIWNGSTWVEAEPSIYDGGWK